MANLSIARVTSPRKFPTNFRELRRATTVHGVNDFWERLDVERKDERCPLFGYYRNE